jgi:hypothetical protein
LPKNSKKSDFLGHLKGLDAKKLISFLFGRKNSLHLKEFRMSKMSHPLALKRVGRKSSKMPNLLDPGKGWM